MRRNKARYYRNSVRLKALQALRKRETYAVYLLEVPSGPKKIGITKGAPVRRLAELQVGNHEEISVVDAISVTAEAAREIEAAAHKLLAGHRIRGEWFGCSREEAIAALEAAYGAFLQRWWGLHLAANPTDSLGISVLPRAWCRPSRSLHVAAPEFV